MFFLHRLIPLIILYNEYFTRYFMVYVKLRDYFKPHNSMKKYFIIVFWKAVEVSYKSFFLWTDRSHTLYIKLKIIHEM